jgi:flagellin
MAQVINTNLMSLNTQRNLNTTQGALATSIQRLSTGLRVNSAKDDAAGLAIAERMNAQVRGMNVAARNANDGISLAQTAEGALGKIGDNLQRMRELAVQSANDTNGVSDRKALDAEFKQLVAENTRVVASTKFNGQALLAGSTFTFQVGAGTVAAEDQISITTANGTTALGTTVGAGAHTTLGGAADADFTSAQALAVMTAIDTALTAINSARADLGAYQNRFEAVVSNLQIAAENQAAARSRIMDADFAAETASLTRAQVLQQAGTAMLSQANSMPNSVLSLLR